jgi:hypothetical protein
MTSFEDTVNYDANMVGVIRDECDVIYYIIKDHILWVDGYAELCWSINDLYWKNDEPMIDPILYQTNFDRFFYEWEMVFPGGRMVEEQE